MSRLPRTFYERRSPDAARDLIGKVLVTESSAGRTSGRIVETEAYCGGSDPASHAYRGLTARNAVMFGPSGFLYVYLSYGVHACCNVVTSPEHEVGAVLLRALEPLEGIELMTARRGGRPGRDLCNGPGKLCQALGIGLEANGTDLEGDAIWIEDDGHAPQLLGIGSRVGITAGTDLPLRYFVLNSPYVSPGKPAGPALVSMVKQPES